MSFLLASCTWNGAPVGGFSAAGPTSTEAPPSTRAIPSTSVADGSRSSLPPDLESTEIVPDESYLPPAGVKNGADESAEESRTASRVQGADVAEEELDGADEQSLEEAPADEDPVDTDPKVASATDGVSGAVVDAILGDAANRLGVEVSALNVVSVESQTFNDSSLGCPEFESSYTQVITPGHIVLIEGAGGTLDYRVNDLHGTFKFCG